MTIRAASAADCAFFPAIERDAAGSFAMYPHLAWTASAPVPTADVWTPIVAQGRSLVASIETDIVGFLAATRHGGFVHIEELSVRRSAQGRGIGRALLLAALAAGRGEGARAATLTTFAAVPWNAPFYARHGFAIVAEADAPPHLVTARTFERTLGFADSDRCAMVAPL